MHAVYVACLLGGAVATALFFLLGIAGAAVGHVGHVHIHLGGHHGSAEHHTVSAHPVHGHGSPNAARLASSFGWILGWLSPLSLAAAAIWFGAIGLVTESSGLAWVFAVVAALLALIVVRAALNAFVRAEVPPLTMTGDGAIGTVNATILPDTTGEVLYTLEGLHRTMPARTRAGRPLPRGTQVVITHRDHGIAWVEPLDPFLDDLNDRPTIEQSETTLRSYDR
jgi:membrane protein implicated in regulation of membrane protease activity